jgi:hypothetical protein
MDSSNLEEKLVDNEESYRSLKFGDIKTVAGEHQAVSTN